MQICVLLLIEYLNNGSQFFGSLLIRCLCHYGLQYSQLLWSECKPSLVQSTVRIQSIIHCQLYWEDENKQKDAGNGPFIKKKSLVWRIIYLAVTLFAHSVWTFYLFIYFSFCFHCVNLSILISSSSSQSASSLCRCSV